MASDSPVASKLSCHVTDTSIASTTLFARTSARTNIDSLFVLSTDMYKQYDVQDSRVLNLHNHKLTVQHPSLNFGSAGSFSHPFFVRVSLFSSFSFCICFSSLRSIFKSIQKPLLLLFWFHLLHWLHPMHDLFLFHQVSIS